MDPYIQERKDNHLLPFKRKTIKTTIQERLISPVLVQKKVLGYCSFIYNNMEKDKLEEDFLLLDRLANAVSLILLNEKTKFESFERMKGNFLEQILQTELPAHEIIKEENMQILTLNSLTMWWLWNTRKQKYLSLSIEDEFYLQEQILESIFQYFNAEKQQILIGQREGKLIFLI